MERNQLIEYIESSFLKELLGYEGITDISYNGRDLYYVLNTEGRKKYEKQIPNNEIKDFLRQLANITEKQFSYLDPILDVNVGRYRINAVYTSIARVGLEEAVNFSLRIASTTNRIRADHKFMNEKLEALFDLLISNHISIIISGVPGVGKTELQKYLLSRVKDNERIIVIDSTIELINLQDNPKVDVSLWQAGEKNKNATISELIKNGLRHNPDWLIVSEARGEEMNDVLNTAMTGIPIITTIHSIDSKSSPFRMARIIMAADKKIEYKSLLENIFHHFKIFVHLRRVENKDKSIKRYISSIVQVDDDGKITEIYNDNLKTKKYAKLSKKFLETIYFPKNTVHLKEFINE